MPNLKSLFPISNQKKKQKLWKSKNFRCNIAIWYPPILGNKRDAFRGKGTLYKIFHPLFHPGKSLKVLKIVLIWLPWRFFSALQSENDQRPNNFAKATIWTTDNGHTMDASIKDIWKIGSMWQTKYVSAVPKNLGLGVDFRPCSEGNFLTWRP